MTPRRVAALVCLVAVPMILVFRARRRRRAIDAAVREINAQWAAGEVPSPAAFDQLLALARVPRRLKYQVMTDAGLR